MTRKSYNEGVIGVETTLCFSRSFFSIIQLSSYHERFFLYYYCFFFLISSVKGIFPERKHFLFRFIIIIIFSLF